MDHTPECNRLQAESENARKLWIALYPNYCRTCSGSGVETFYESHGSPYGSEMMTDPCWNCVLEGRRPRCSGPHDSENDDEPCAQCGWNFAAGGMPEAYVCYGDCVPPDTA